MIPYWILQYLQNLFFRFRYLLIIRLMYTKDNKIFKVLNNTPRTIKIYIFIFTFLLDKIKVCVLIVHAFV